MEKSRQGTCLLIGLLGLIAVATSIAAEYKRTKISEVRYYNGGCSFPESSELPLAITAAVCLFLSQLIANVKGGCTCCCAKNLHAISCRNRLIATPSLVLSWITFIFMMFVLIVGLVLNAPQSQLLDRECNVVRPGVFSAVAVLSFVTTAFALIYYVAITGKGGESDLSLLSASMPVATPSLNSDSASRIAAGIELNLPLFQAKERAI